MPAPTADPPSPGSTRERLLWHSTGIDAVPDDDAWLTPRERAWVERMRFEKRRSEFRLGRFNAKQALARHLGLEPSPTTLHRLEIDRAPDGAPVPLVDGAPAPVSISMTDRADWAVCVLGPPGLGLGCDLELVEPRSAAFVRDYLTTTEQARVESAADEDERQLRANLVWCAKESALKVLRTGLRRDTRSVEVEWEASGSSALASTAKPGLESSADTGADGDGWRPLLVRTLEGRRFPGWWRRYGEFLLSVTVTEPTTPPLSLVEPPPLAAARPTHRWWPPRRS